MAFQENHYSSVISPSNQNAFATVRHDSDIDIFLSLRLIVTCRDADQKSRVLFLSDFLWTQKIRCRVIIDVLNRDLV